MTAWYIWHVDSFENSTDNYKSQLETNNEFLLQYILLLFLFSVLSLSHFVSSPGTEKGFLIHKASLWAMHLIPSLVLELLVLWTFAVRSNIKATKTATEANDKSRNLVSATTPEIQRALEMFPGNHLTNTHRETDANRRIIVDVILGFTEWCTNTCFSLGGHPSIFLWQTHWELVLQISTHSYSVLPFTCIACDVINKCVEVKGDKKNFVQYINTFHSWVKEEEELETTCKMDVHILM